MWKDEQEKIDWLKNEIEASERLLERCGKRTKLYKQVQKNLQDFRYSLSCLESKKETA